MYLKNYSQLKDIFKIEKTSVSKENLKLVPEQSGIYVYWSHSNSPLYIGKSINLRKRLDSYLALNLSIKTSQLMKEAKYFSFIVVNSELESLLLEAYLVKKYLPHFNIQLKDDKHPLYIKITKEKYPRVLTARKIDENNFIGFYGPFPSSSNVKKVLKMLRKIFPYSQHKLGKRPCIYREMGLCNPCPNQIERITDLKLKKEEYKKYIKNIRFIKNILSGKITFVRKKLVKLMMKFSNAESFEEALNIKKQLQELDYITQPITPINNFLENPNLIEDIRKEESTLLAKLLEKYFPINNIKRIECFDIAHISGVKPTASMVTFIDGEPEKSLYRHFKINQKKGNDDISSMKEVARRREKYLADWGVPDLMIIDGGKAQIGAFLFFFQKEKIPIIGLEKRFETFVIAQSTKDNNINFIKVRVPKGPVLNLVQRVRNEAHRFARRYHHQLLNKSLLNFE